MTNLLDLDRLARGIVAPKLHPTDLGALVRRVLAESELLSGSRLHTESASRFKSERNIDHCRSA